MNILSKSLEDIAHLVIAIATVEITASAKIFFETHFNNIFSTPVTPRSQRRRKFEQRLVKEELTSEERAQARQEWARKESMHLRQLRSLKTRSLERAGSRGINVAGYEVVKVLGKGSFGVVRLVKEVIVTPKPVAVSNIGTPAIVPTDRTSEASAASSGISKISSRVPRAFATRERSHTETCVYAMKVIRKSSMLRNSQEAHLRAERDFLVASEGSRWIVPLIASFQDGTNLYLVMEYMVGGDFLGLLIREQVLDEDVTKWYIAEMILCIEEAHALKWIHRDVKPDNFLISALGHLKISDFGLAFDGHWAHDQSYFHGQRWSLLEKLGIEIKGDAIDREEQQTLAASSRAADAHMAGQGKDQKHNNHSSSEEAVKKEGILNWRNRTGMRDMAKSMVGTSQYMAPEVIRGDPYDGRCDWWSLGIILYEVCFIQ
jgi:serine/threonine protein kinase